MKTLQQLSTELEDAEKRISMIEDRYWDLEWKYSIHDKNFADMGEIMFHLQREVEKFKKGCFLWVRECKETLRIVKEIVDEEDSLIDYSKLISDKMDDLDSFTRKIYGMVKSEKGGTLEI